MEITAYNKEMGQMSVIDNIFKIYDDVASFNQISYVKSKYGFEWSLRDGIILYPANSFAGFNIVPMRKTLPDVPLLICDDNPERIGNECNGQRICSIDGAVIDLPNALFVICGSTFVEIQEYFLKIASYFSDVVNIKIINYRQLGDILPIGTRKTQNQDVYRKTNVFARNRNKVLEAYALFTDALSKSVFTSILKRYLFSSDALIPVSNEEDEYFEKVYNRNRDEVFIDCGGFTGDTLMKYIKLYGSDFKEYLIFEPDPTNFAMLNNNMALLPPGIKNKVVAFNYAVGHEEDVISFDAWGNAGSSVISKGGINIKCVTLDNLLKTKHPSFIKLDIEGYEAFALYGAKEIIAKYRPTLAVCVYHHPNDLYELPLLIRKIAPDYHFILRSYGEQYDYVCYAVPLEKIK